MELNWPTIWAAIGSLATCAAAGATAWAAYQAKRAAQISEQVSRESEKNTQLEIFLKFSEEYDTLKAELYEKYFHQGVAFEDDQITSLKILKLFEKEYHLYRHGMIQQDTWKNVLEPKVVSFVNHPLVKATWDMRQNYKQYDFGDAFEKYVEEVRK